MRTPLRQRGATLLIALIMLVMLTLFAISAMNLSNVNLKIAGNFQSQGAIEAMAQVAIEQILTNPENFSLTPAAQDICSDGSVKTTGTCSGTPVGNVTAPVCNFSVTATNYTKRIGELAPQDNDWEVVATVTDPVTSAKAVIHQGVRIRMLAGNCP